MPRRRFRYVRLKQEKTRKTIQEECHMTSFDHVISQDIHCRGTQLVVTTGTTVTITKVVSCANGVWFKTAINGSSVWFLGNGERSYKTIYQE